MQPLKYKKLNTLLLGDSIPNNSLGSNNDLFLNTSTGFLYRKENGIYVFKIALAGVNNENLASLPTVNVGETSLGETANVSNSGTSGNVVLDFQIPNPLKGDKGEKGNDGINGISPTFEIDSIELLNYGEQPSIENIGTENNSIYILKIPKTEKGIDGISPNLSIGNVTVSDNINTPSVQITGDSINRILNFVLPKASKGDDGSNGITPNFTIGNVQTINSNLNAEVSLRGSLEHPILDFKLPKGITGDNGTIPTITIGNVTTGLPNSSASISVRGTSQNIILDFNLPQGISGANGNNGQDGASSSINIGQITTLDSNSQASVTNSGNSLNAILNFSIPKGDKGLKGDKGDNGNAASISVGNVNTVSSSTPASITNSGNTSNVILDFNIPRGIAGIDGINGSSGMSPTVAIGTTSTGNAGTQALVTNSGNNQNLVLNFTIPKGSDGTNGNNGTNGTSPTITIGTITTLTAGNSATVTNSGTSNNLILNFGIPKGSNGTNGIDGTSNILTVTSPLVLASNNLSVTTATTSNSGLLSAADKTKLDATPKKVVVPFTVTNILTLSYDIVHNLNTLDIASIQVWKSSAPLSLLTLSGVTLKDVNTVTITFVTLALGTYRVVITG